MARRLTIGFGDPTSALRADSGVHGVAIAGAGVLLALGGGVIAAGPPEVTEGDGGGVRISGAGAYDVALEPLGAPATLAPPTTAWLCRAHGTVAGKTLDGIGAVTRSTTDAAALERDVTIWFGPALAIALHARRPAAACGHGDEQLAAAILRGEPPELVSVADPRLSTTYDADGRPVHCGIELWETDESDFADRAGGEAIAHGELRHPDGSRTLVAFLACHGVGHRQGTGYYALTRP